MRGKEHYDKPETALARLELESPICSGSVNYKEGKEGVYINEQDIENQIDFSNDSWDNVTTGQS